MKSTLGKKIIWRTTTYQLSFHQYLYQRKCEQCPCWIRGQRKVRVYINYPDSCETPIYYWSPLSPLLPETSEECNKKGASTCNFDTFSMTEKWSFRWACAYVQSRQILHCSYTQKAVLWRSRPRGYKTWVHSKTQNKAQRRVRKQPIIVLYSEFEAVLKFYDLEARSNIKHQTDQVSVHDFMHVPFIQKAHDFTQLSVLLELSDNSFISVHYDCPRVRAWITRLIWPKLQVRIILT